jgi:hypothetical protein
LSELFVSAFVTFLVVIDPPGCAPIFASITAGTTPQHRRAMALRSVGIAAGILIFFGLLGRDLPAVVRRADIVVAAVGRAGMVTGDWLKPGATVIDVGQERVDMGDGTKKLIGDVEFDSAASVAGAITPVPGGVGPMTIAVLLRNCVAAAYARAGLPAPAGL